MTPRPRRRRRSACMKPCSRMPRPSANAPMIIASVRPTSWMIGAPRNPPADATAGQQYRRRDAMHEAQARQAHGHPVEPGGGNRQLAHARRYSAASPRSYNITSARFCELLPARRRRTRIGARRMDSHRLLPHRARRTRPLALSNLLFFVAGLVFAMVVVGGITRLTESGLSITEWKPVSGAIPPLTHADWQHAFDLYQQTPAISGGRRPCRNDARRASSSSSSGNGCIGCSAASSASSSSSASRWFAVEARDPERLWLAARGAVRPRRTAGRGRLVHGHVGPRRPHRGQPLSPFRASAVRPVPLRGADLDRARPARRPRADARRG